MTLASGRIGCCLAGAPGDDAALAEGARLARVTGLSLQVVHATADPGQIESERLTEHGPRGVSEHDPIVIPDRGHAASAVCAWAEEEGIGVLVAAPHRGPLARLLLGSFTSHLAHNAPCDVLVARPASHRAAVAAQSATEVLAPGVERLMEPVEPLRTDQTLQEAIARLGEQGCALPVVDEMGQHVGILGAAEILDAIRPPEEMRIAGAEKPPSDYLERQRRLERTLARLVVDCMREPVAVRPDDTALHTAEVMSREGVEAVPVIRSWSRIAGLVRASAILADLSREEVAHRGIPADANADADAFHHIACCVDDSSATFQALMTAAGLRDRSGGSLTAVHALRAPDDDESAAAARRVLEDAAAQTGARTALVFGNPPHAIERWAADGGVDLLVAASHRGVMARLVLGSFARHLIHRAPCSVLLVRRREPAVEPS